MCRGPTFCFSILVKTFNQNAILNMVNGSGNTTKLILSTTSAVLGGMCIQNGLPWIHNLILGQNLQKAFTSSILYLALESGIYNSNNEKKTKLY